MRRKNDRTLVPLDTQTWFWLRRLERITKTPAGEIVASMLRDIMVDDELSHQADETCH